MPHLNVCSFMGHVGQAAKLKTNKDGTKSWAEFTLAVSTGTKDNPKTMWVKCRSFNKPERVIEKCNKGDAVYVSGRLDVSAYARKQDNVATPDVNLMISEWHWLKESGRNAKPDATDIPVYNSTVAAPADDFDLPF
jgi:single-stranded DNA-binding protein